MGYTREEEIKAELNEVLTGLMLEVFSGTTKKEDALELLNAMSAKIMPALQEIEDAAKQIENY